jgi:hypothetical protein
MFVVFFAARIVMNAVVSTLIRGAHVPWLDIVGCIGMIFGTAIILWLCRHWCNFLAGSEVCKWRIDR